MKTTKIALTAAALAGILSLAVSSAQAEDMKGGDAKTEKCYGVVKAGMNDCGASGHSCAGHAAASGDKGEWVKMPAGLCDKIVGGTTMAPEKK